MELIYTMSKKKHLFSINWQMSPNAGILTAIASSAYGTKKKREWPATPAG
jgi:hypothetical protein